MSRGILDVTIGDNYSADLTASQLGQIDAVCLQFESSWIEGEQPVIESYLHLVEDELKTATLFELLRLDIDYRHRAGDSISTDAYLKRFPNDCQVIDSAVADCDPESPADQMDVTADRSVDLLKQSLNFNSDYRIEQFHARGGLGEIYIAHDLKLNRRVAIKIPRNRHANSRENKRLRREAELTSRLQHPGIVSVHALNDEAGSLPCYVMQFIEGETFKDAIERFHEQWPRDRASKYASQEFRQLLQRLVNACNAIAYAHEQGVIHRDIKPSNVMLGQFGETFLLDWGLAKTLETIQPEFQVAAQAPSSEETSQQDTESPSMATRPGQPLGTPEFASPEQISGNLEQQGIHSDVYSLGATLYYLLLGQGTIDVDELNFLELTKAQQKIRSPSQVDSSVPRDLDAVCMQAIAFRTTDRYPDVMSFADDIERILADEPVSVRRPNWSTRMSRWARKNPRLATGIASGLSVGLVALIIGTWLISQQASNLATALKDQQYANEQMNSARKSAERYAEETRSALRTMSSQMVDHWFARQDSFSDEERKFLTKILHHYQAFSRTLPDQQTRLGVQTESLQRVAEIQSLLGQYPEALNTLNEAIQLLSDLPADASAELRQTRAVCTYLRGKLIYVQGDMQMGMADLQQALQFALQLKADFPTHQNHYRLLASVRQHMGFCHLRRGQFPEAVEEFDQAKTTAEALLQFAPDDPRWRELHAHSLKNLGLARRQTGQGELALTDLKLALDIFGELEAGSNQTNLFRTAGFAETLCLYGSSLDAKFDAEKKAAYLKSAEVAQNLTLRFPSYARGYFHLASALYWMTFLHSVREDQQMYIEYSQQASEAAAKLVQLAPDVRTYHELRTQLQKRYAWALKSAGDYEAAENAYNQCVEFARQGFQLEPDFGTQTRYTNRTELVRSLCWLGRVQLILKKKEDAFANFEEAIETARDGLTEGPNRSKLKELYVSTCEEYAKLLFDNGERDRSIEYLNKIAKYVDSRNPIQSLREFCLTTESAPNLFETIREFSEQVDTAEQAFGMATALAEFHEALDDTNQQATARTLTGVLLQRATELGQFDSRESLSAFLDSQFFQFLKRFEEFEDFLRILDSKRASVDS